MVKEKICGIYKITSPTGRVYVGQSKDINKRWSYYKTLNCKYQTKLYHSLKKHGVENHKFEIVCECNELHLNEYEVYYINKFESFNTPNGLNLVNGGGAAISVSDYTRIKMGNIRRGVKSRVGTSSFAGVSQERRYGRWVSKIGFLNKCYHLGTFDTEEEAVKSYLEALDKVKTNTFNEYFESIRYRQSSLFDGVSFDIKKKKWSTSIKYLGKQIYIGCFLEEIKARDRYVNAASHILSNTFDDYLQKIKRKTSSAYRGIYFDKNISKWRSEIVFSGVRLFLRNSDTEKEAINTLDEANVHINMGTFEEYFESIKPKYSSTVSGVSWHSRDKKWTATVRVSEKRKSLGYFLTEEDAINKINEFRKINPK